MCCQRLDLVVVKLLGAGFIIVVKRTSRFSSRRLTTESHEHWAVPVSLCSHIEVLHFQIFVLCCGCFITILNPKLELFRKVYILIPFASRACVTDTFHVHIVTDR